MRRVALTAILLAAACSDSGLPPHEALSLLNVPLISPPLPEDIAADRTERYEMAAREYEANPDDADALIWFGRRTAYLGRYRAAIGIFGEGTSKHPSDPRMYRHRGHRMITAREFDHAIRDLTRAAELVQGQPDEVELDGLPNAAGIPTSTLQSNIWYHLGLAYYLSANYEGALRAFEEGQTVSTNNDMRVATTYWHVMTLHRLDRADEAGGLLQWVTPELELLENFAYRNMLLLFKGELAAESVLDTSGDDDAALANATVGYGVGFWHEMQGRDDVAVEIWQRTLEGTQWAGFGYIASEAEIARRR